MIRVIDILYRLKGVWAVIAALAVGAVLVSWAGASPTKAYSALFRGAFLDYHGIATTLVKMSPLLLSSLAVIVPLRAGLYNIGGEGQMYVGAMCATLAALYLPTMPALPTFLACSVAGMLGGAAWAFIPAYLKAVRGSNEVIITLLMNYVGVNLVSYAVSGPLMEEGAPYPFSRRIPDVAELPYILDRTDAHAGVVVGVVLAVLIYVVFTRTTAGLSLTLMGESRKCAELAGIRVKTNMALALVCGGALAGLAGTYEVLGLKHRLFHLFAGGYGYDGIVVAFLASGGPLTAIAAAGFLGGLRSGANIMQRSVGVPTTVVEAIQGLIVLFVAMSIALKFYPEWWSKRLQRCSETASKHTEAAP